MSLYTLVSIFYMHGDVDITESITAVRRHVQPETVGDKTFPAKRLAGLPVASRQKAMALWERATTEWGMDKEAMQKDAEGIEYCQQVEWNTSIGEKYCHGYCHPMLICPPGLPIAFYEMPKAASSAIKSLLAGFDVPR